MQRIFLTALAAIFAACAIPPAAAQTISTSVAIGWVAPTKNADGTMISGALTYNLYQGASGGTFTKVASGLTGTSTVVTSVAAGNCFAMTTVEMIGSSSVESISPSSPTCIAIPGAPSNVTVTLTITLK